MSIQVTLDLPEKIFRMVEEAAQIEEKSVPEWIIGYMEPNLIMCCGSDYALDYWPVGFLQKDVEAAFKDWENEEQILLDY